MVARADEDEARIVRKNFEKSDFAQNCCPLLGSRGEPMGFESFGGEQTRFDILEGSYSHDCFENSSEGH